MFCAQMCVPFFDLITVNKIYGLEPHEKHNEACDVSLLDFITFNITQPYTLAISNHAVF